MTATRALTLDKLTEVEAAILEGLSQGFDEVPLEHPAFAGARRTLAEAGAVWTHTTWRDAYREVSGADVGDVVFGVVVVDASF